jgi:hypothetical protein
MNQTSALRPALSPRAALQLLTAAPARSTEMVIDRFDQWSGPATASVLPTWFGEMDGTAR